MIFTINVDVYEMIYGRSNWRWDHKMRGCKIAGIICSGIILLGIVDEIVFADSLRVWYKRVIRRIVDDINTICLPILISFVVCLDTSITLIKM
jgi:hypothetical protein